MTIGEILTPLSTILRFVLSVFGRRSSAPIKRLEARMVMRGIIAELPDEIPLHISDADGSHYKGVYVIGLFIWNRGNQPIVSADLTPTAPLHIKIGADAKVVSARPIPVEHQTVCSATLVDQNTLAIVFDCLNPKEYLVLPIFVTGNPMTEVQITGRIIGQEGPIDHTAAEVKAAFGERLATLLMLCFILNAIPGFIFGGWLILHQYGLAVLLHSADTIPVYLMAPFTMGALVSLMLATSRVMNWFERRNVPEGYPLYADLEPPLIENVVGMLRTVFKGKKQRISASLFDWGKPILMPDNKVRRRTVDDWIERS